LCFQQQLHCSPSSLSCSSTAALAPTACRRQATERSNKQILTPLNWFDIALVACLSGVSEELLFRGAIIPGSFLDWWVQEVQQFHEGGAAVL